MGKPQFIFLSKDKLWFGFSQMKGLDYPNLSCTWSEVFGIQITSINSKNDTCMSIINRNKIKRKP